MSDTIRQTDLETEPHAAGLYRTLFNVGQLITSQMDLEVLMEVVIEQTNRIMGTERGTILVYDESDESLWSLVATGLKKNKIRIPSDYGVAGLAFQKRTPIIVNDAYSDDRFGSDIDREIGFVTKNILCVPLINRREQCIGVLQALNKTSGDFTDNDSKILSMISRYVTIALENARLYEELKLLDRAKEKVINHLSHELKTPLAIISVVFDQISSKLRRAGIDEFERLIGRGLRGVRRLRALEDKIEDILNEKSVEEKERIVNLLEDAAGFLEEAIETSGPAQSGILQNVLRRIESVYAQTEEIRMEDIPADEFLSAVCNEALLLSGYRRDVEIGRDVEKGMILHMDKTVLGKICRGLLKNAMENTPDGGKITVSAKPSEGGIRIDFADPGIGISSVNQKLIFTGFFHTQATQSYSSKTPYEFNAGGTGSDLLRMRVFSERLGFSIDFESERCRFIPEDTDACPGKISDCKFITDKTECSESGGSVFSVVFPPHMVGAQER